MTFAVLHALHAIIGDAILDIERVYRDTGTTLAPSDASSVPPSPSPSSSPSPSLSSSQFSAQPRSTSPSLLSSTTLAPSSAHTHIHAPRPRTASPRLPSSPNLRPTRIPSPIPRTRSRSSAHAHLHPSPNLSRSPSPSPSIAAPLDFPALDAPCDPASPAEALTAHPDVANAISRIVAAAGHLSATVRAPFLTLCDASMAYHLPACLRFLEAAHIPELLRDAGPAGVRASRIAERTGVDETKIAHILRLLATHHVVQEAAPDAFAMNRVSSLLDTGKAFDAIVAWPAKKYEDTNGTAAFVALNTDELFKASAYLTDALLPDAAGPTEDEIARETKAGPGQAEAGPSNPRAESVAHSGSAGGAPPRMPPRSRLRPPPPRADPASVPMPVPVNANPDSSADAPSTPSPRTPTVPSPTARALRGLLSPRPSLASSTAATHGSTPNAAYGSPSSAHSTPTYTPASTPTPSHASASMSMSTSMLSTPLSTMTTSATAGHGPHGAGTLASPGSPHRRLLRSPKSMGALFAGARADSRMGAGDAALLMPSAMASSPALAPSPMSPRALWRPKSKAKLRTKSQASGSVGLGVQEVEKAHVGRVGEDEAAAARKRKRASLPPHPRTAFHLSQRTDAHFWAWLEAPGNERRLRRFGSAMGGSRGWEEEDGFASFPFDALPPGSLVVDVGGGIGSTSMRLAEAHPGLRFVIQDREAVCALGIEAWRERCPELIESGRATFQVHDFFTPQPVHGAPPAAFILRVICHDWPDAFARRILLQLRKAARDGGEGGRPTYLVLGDHVLPYACAQAEERRGGDDNGEVGGGEGAEDETELRPLRGARWPLLANMGKASASAYSMDLTMQVTFNGLERTLPELRALLASAGWRIVRVSRMEGSLFGRLVAVPAPIPLVRRSVVLSGSLVEPGDGEGRVHRTAAADESADDEDEDEDEVEQERMVAMAMASRPSTPSFGLFGAAMELPPVVGRRVVFERGDGRGQGKGGGKGLERKGPGAWIRWMKRGGRAKPLAAAVGDGMEGEGEGEGGEEKGEEKDMVVVAGWKVKRVGSDAGAQDAIVGGADEGGRGGAEEGMLLEAALQEREREGGTRLLKKVSQLFGDGLKSA